MNANTRVAELLAMHGLELARHIRRIVRDDDAAQDLLQDTLLRAHKALTRLGDGANERAWLYRIATNVSLNHLRDGVRERRALERAAHEAPSADYQRGEETEGRREALWRRVAELPEKQRVAITLRVADELEYDEIARRMGGTEQAARANVYQATKRLRLEVR